MLIKSSPERGIKTTLRRSLSVSSSYFVPQYQTETRLTERLLAPQEKGWVLEWFLAALSFSRQYTSRAKVQTKTHLAHETPPTPLAPQRFNSSNAVSDTLLARLALWQPKSHVASLAVRVTLVYRKANIIVDKVAISRNVQLTPAPKRQRERTTRREEWVPTLSTEKVLFVVHTFTESGIVERDEPLVDDGSLAVETTRSKCLHESYTLSQWQS